MLMKANDKALTPQLRFPEFKNGGEWEEKKLGEISNIVKEKLGKNNYTLLSITAGHGLVSQLEKFGKEIAGSSYENYIVIHKNDFAYNKSATKDYQSGYVALLKTYDVAAVPNSIFLCFRIDETILNVFFLEQLFKFNYHDKYLRKLIQIGARAHGSLNISNKDFFSIPIPVPPLKEQKKIADFLSSVDELIELEKIKLEKLKEYKKGLLQNLFPKENQKVPDLRFPEFKNSGEWEEKKLGELTLDINERNESDLTTVLSVTNTYGIVEQEDFFQRIVASKDLSNYKVIRKGDIAYNPSRINVGSIDLLQNYDIGVMSPMYVIVRCKENILNNEFLKQWLLSNTFYSLMEKNLQGGVRKSLPYNIFKNIKIVIPPLKEQQQIAEFLSSVDELIIEQDNKIKLLHDYKKGLLQQLFLQGDLT